MAYTKEHPMTELQFKALEHYAFHEMSPVNTALPETLEETGSYLWSHDLQEVLGTCGRGVGGVLHALEVNGWATVQSPNIKMSNNPGKQRNAGRDPDGWFHFTPAGFAAWQAERLDRGLPITR